MRRTSAEIDADIVDAAARILAVRGVERTTVQEVADATGYSKTGLLHRVESKAGLVGEVVDGAVATLQAVLPRLVAVPAGPGHLRAVMRTVYETAADHPGLLLLVMSSRVPPGARSGTDGRVASDLLVLDGPLAPLAEPVGQLMHLVGVLDGPAEQVLRHRMALQMLVETVVQSATWPASALGDRLAAVVVEAAVRVAEG